jgi:hypothetical protein
MLLILLCALAAAWAGIILVVAAACASAARGDRALFAVHALARPRPNRACGGASEPQTLPPRSTWRTVRSSTLMSSQSDQLATYR